MGALPSDRRRENWSISLDYNWNIVLVSNNFWLLAVSKSNDYKIMMALICPACIRPSAMLELSL